MATPQTTRQPGKTESVYAQIKSEIEDGTFLPGQTMPETMLVEHTGASRTPVREALRRLAAEGLVEIAPRTPATVARISLRTVRELFDFRRVVEPAAIRAVVGETARNERIAAYFSKLADRFGEISGAEYSAEFAAEFRQLTSEFDTSLIEFTPNAHLRRSIEELRPHTTRLRRIAHTDHGRLGESVEEHIAMCRAIVAGDAIEAGRTLEDHLVHVDRAIFHALLGEQQGVSAGIVDLVS